MGASRSAVVTGIGLITPCGLDRESTWQAVTQGRSGIGPVTRFDAAPFSCRVAGEVKGFKPADYVPRRDAQRLDLFELYALAAAQEAMDDAALSVAEAGPSRVGVLVGVGLGGIGSMERYHAALLDRGPRRISPFLVPMMIPNMAPSHISMRFGIHGPSHAIATACASGAHAIGEALHWIRSGVVDAVLAGGAEAAVTPLAVGGFCAMRALTSCSDPARASRPFDKRRDGFVLSEGAAVLVIEQADAAMRRGAKVYAELAGYGSTSDAYHITQPDPEGRGQRGAMARAMEDGGIDPSDLGYINAHGTSTPQNDVAEAKAIRTLLGPEQVRKTKVSSTKSTTGHLLGAAGALEAAVSALAIQRGVIPPTINLDEPDPDCELLHVKGSAQEQELSAALTNSFGFGGTNATLAFTKGT